SGDSSSMSSGCTTQRRKVSYSPVWRSMATRASMSPPCFLRVADARAASSASKITLLSTPFSLETASTTNRISLFMALSLPFQFVFKIRDQPCLADVAERQTMQHSVHLDAHLIRLAALQGAAEAAPPLDGQRQLDPGLRAREAGEVAGLAQWPVQTRRRHFQRVGARDRVLHVQDRAHLPAHDLAVVHRDARLLVDVDAEQAATALGMELQFHHLISQHLDGRFQQSDQFLVHAAAKGSISISSDNSIPGIFRSGGSGTFPPGSCPSENPAAPP